MAKDTTKRIIPFLTQRVTSLLMLFFCSRHRLYRGRTALQRRYPLSAGETEAERETGERRERERGTASRGGEGPPQGKDLFWPGIEINYRP